MNASPLNRRDRKAEAQVPNGVEPAGMTVAPGEEAEAPVASASASPSKWLEIAVAAAAVGLTAAVYLLGGAIELRIEQPGMTPRSWPQLLGGLGLALSIVLLLIAVLRPPQSRSELEASTRPGWLRLLLTVAATIAFLAAWPLLGFVFTAPVFIAVVTAIGGGRGVRALLIYPVVMAALIYALFNLLLKVPL
ncbi:tripartite tricarboxylate transporter TctB family protein [Arthrobacter sp. R1-13]